jgi:transcriptional regulator with XRE-family HTH domain
MMKKRQSIYEINEEQMKNLCRRVREKRLARGISLEELALGTGVSCAILQEIEEGNITDVVTVEQLQCLSGFFSVPIWKLFA